MKNMKIKVKLLVGFLIIALLAGVIGVVGIFGLLSTAEDAQSINDRSSNAVRSARLVRNAYQQRADIRGAAMMQAWGRYDDAKGMFESLKALDSEFRATLAEIPAGLATDEGRAIYAKIEPLYDDFEHKVSEFEQLVLANADSETIQSNFSTLTQPLLDTTASIVALTDYLDESTTLQAADAQSQANFLTIVSLSVVIVSLIIAVVLGLYIANLIAKPTRELLTAAKQLSVGDIDVSLQNNSKDELGELATAFKEMSDGINKQASVLAQVSEGDYTASIAIRSDKDIMNRSISTLLDNNNEVLLNIKNSADQVSGGASQIAIGAQSLATGSTEQAASIEELSAAISEVQTQANENNEIATQTLKDTEEAGKLMAVSMDYMTQMGESMRSISESSQSIGRVIKVIDDIAFQTNILALNAAVEAARAGQHGKGFAVVADEVRNLASKSAEAAKETAELIETSVQNVTKGEEIANKTNESLVAVGDIAASNAVGMKKLSDAASNQSKSITEITVGINQISEVVQANSATSEQSAASAEEMAAQSTMMNEVVSRFRLRDDNRMPSSQSYDEQLYLGDDSKY